MRYWKRIERSLETYNHRRYECNPIHFYHVTQRKLNEFLFGMEWRVLMACRIRGHIVTEPTYTEKKVLWCGRGAIFALWDWRCQHLLSPPFVREKCVAHYYGANDIWIWLRRRGGGWLTFARSSDSVSLFCISLKINIPAFGQSFPGFSIHVAFEYCAKWRFSPHTHTQYT